MLIVGRAASSPPEKVLRSLGLKIENDWLQFSKNFAGENDFYQHWSEVPDYRTLMYLGFFFFNQKLVLVLTFQNRLVLKSSIGGNLKKIDLNF